jgi:CBS domain-containing protein
MKCYCALHCVEKHTLLTVAELSERIARGDPAVARRQGALVGLITRSDCLRALEQDPKAVLGVLEAGSRNFVVTYPDESLQDAVTKMLKNEIGRLPVVSREDPRQLLGYLVRTGLLEARSRKMQEEEHRERRWNVVSTAK